MHTETLHKPLRGLLILALSITVIGWTPVRAQEPIMINVMRIQLKPAMTERFRALHLTQTVPSQQSSGMPWRLTTSNFFGDNFEVVVSTPLENFAELDHRNFVPTELGQALFSASVDHRQRLVVQTRPDMGIPGGDLTGLRRMAYLQVSQGQIAEFEEFWRGTVLPAMRSRGIQGYQMFQTLIGEPQGQYIGGLWLDNFAALDSLEMNTLLTADQQRRFGNLVEEYVIEVQVVDRELSWGLPGL